MKDLPIQTTNLSLIPMTKEQTLAMVEAMTPEDRAQVSAEWLAQLHASASKDVWKHGFSIVHHEADVEVGQCAFKGPPSSDGIVEIAYGINPEHRSNGYATEAAAGLTDFALSCNEVRVVRAHTLPENNASVKVLTKCGFRHIGEVLDPDDGLVWRWEKP